MLRKINYHTSTEIWLSLEDYHNAGLTSKETKEVIESIAVEGRHLYCMPGGVNQNWNINVRTKDPLSIKLIVLAIQDALENALAAKKK